MLFWGSSDISSERSIISGSYSGHLFYFQNFHQNKLELYQRMPLRDEVSLPLYSNLSNLRIKTRRLCRCRKVKLLYTRTRGRCRLYLLAHTVNRICLLAAKGHYISTDTFCNRKKQALLPCMNHRWS